MTKDRSNSNPLNIIREWYTEKVLLNTQENHLVVVICFRLVQSKFLLFHPRPDRPHSRQAKLAKRLVAASRLRLRLRPSALYKNPLPCTL